MINDRRSNWPQLIVISALGATTPVGVQLLFSSGAFVPLSSAGKKLGREMAGEEEVEERLLWGSPRCFVRRANTDPESDQWNKQANSYERSLVLFDFYGQLQQCS